MVTNPREGPDRDFPWVSDLRSRPNENTTSYSASEQTEKKPSPTVERLR